MPRRSTKTTENVVETKVTANEKVEKPIKAIEITVEPTTEIEVQSNFAGNLIYISRKTGEEFSWVMGDINFMPYSELETMRNTQRKFFENNWIKLNGEEGRIALKKLRVDTYYNNFVDLEKIEEYSHLSESEIIEKISSLKQESKDYIAVAIRGMINNGTVSNLKVIKAFEKAVGYNLLEE